ncbi:MAG: hypothetical protein ACAI38_07025 [Myxococcota bacterium]
MSRVAGGSLPNQVATGAATGSAGLVTPQAGQQRVAGGSLPMKPSEYLAELRRLNPGVSEPVLRAQVHEWMKQMLPANQG